MLLKNHSLGQIDERYIRSLSHEDLIKLSTKLLEDLKEAREQLNQGPSNSSRPPSSQAPWESGEELEQEDEPSSDEAISGAEDAGIGEEEAEAASGKVGPNTPEGAAKRCKAGKQEGTPGYGRTQQVAVTHTVDHRAESCEVCERAANEDTEQRPWTAFSSLDIEVSEGEELGLRVTNTKHIF